MVGGDTAAAKRVGIGSCWLDVPETWIPNGSNGRTSPTRTIEVNVYDDIPVGGWFIYAETRLTGATVVLTRAGVVTVLKKRVGNMTIYSSISPPDRGPACHAEVRTRTLAGEQEALQIAARLRPRPR